MKHLTLFLSILTLTMSVMNPLAARADESPVVPIQQLKTKSGINIWLVESHTLPMVSVEVAFKAGSMYDPQGKEGVANMTAAMLTQGGVDGMSSEEYLKQSERLGTAIAADADIQTLSAGMQSLSENVDEAFALFAKALLKPDFNKADFERVKEALLAARKRIQENAGKLASEAFDELIFGRYHPYAHATIGTDYSLPALTRKDVKDYYDKMLNRKNMYVSIVGDITPDQAKALVETHLSQLPKGATVKLPAAPKPQPPVLQKLTLAVPQTSIMMGHAGISRQNPDYFAVLLMNHIFGSGGFSSILMEEVREKRGLAYSIQSYFEPLPHWGPFQVSVKTKNESAYQVVGLVKAEIEKLKENGVSQEAYEEAMDYMVGSFPLRLDSNSNILSYLTFMQAEDMGADYLDKWLENMRNVSQEDVHRAAQKYLHPEQMIVVMVGQPDAVVAAQKPAAPKKQAPEKVAPKAAVAPAVVVKPVPVEVVEPIAEDTLVEEESVSAAVSKSTAAPAKEAAPVTVVPNTAEKIIIPDDPEKLKAAEDARQKREAAAAPKAQGTKSASKAAVKKEPKVSTKDLRQLKDPKKQTRTRRNVDADEWL